MIIKYLGYSVLMIAFLLLTFFGMGPVLFADGSMKERVLSLTVVLLLYVVLVVLLFFWKKRYKAKSKIDR